MKGCTIATVSTVLLFGLVYCGPIQKRSVGREGDDSDMDLGNLFPDDLLEELNEWAQKLAEPFVDAAKEYKDEPVGFNDHDVQYQMVNGTRVKVETSVKKKQVNGTEITVIDRKIDDGKNGTVIKANHVIAQVALKHEANKNNDDNKDGGEEEN